MNLIVFRHLIFVGLITEQNSSDIGRQKKAKSINLNLVKIINLKCPMSIEVWSLV